MSTRPCFIVYPGEPLPQQIDIDFLWIRGQAHSRRVLCADELAHAIRSKFPEGRHLEVSTYSRTDLGLRLSAMNVRFRSGCYADRTVESVYQSSKVFANGGPYLDIIDDGYVGNPKRDPRLQNSGDLEGFHINSTTIALSDAERLYDAIYITALRQNPKLFTTCMSYNIFTDIAYNPKTMHSTQAAAIATALAMDVSGCVPLNTSILDLNTILQSFKNVEGEKEQLKTQPKATTQQAEQQVMF